MSRGYCSLYRIRKIAKGTNSRVDVKNMSKEISRGAGARVGNHKGLSMLQLRQLTYEKDVSSIKNRGFIANEVLLSPIS